MFSGLGVLCGDGDKSRHGQRGGEHHIIGTMNKKYIF
jgi:hypothetical protein